MGGYDLIAASLASQQSALFCLSAPPTSVNGWTDSVLAE